MQTCQILGETKMRALLWTLGLLVTLSSAAVAGPKEDALQVLEKWAKAFTDSDVAPVSNPARPVRDRRGDRFGWHG